MADDKPPEVPPSIRSTEGMTVDELRSVTSSYSDRFDASSAVEPTRIYIVVYDVIHRMVRTIEDE